MPERNFILTDYGFGAASGQETVNEINGVETITQPSIGNTIQG